MSAAEALVDFNVIDEASSMVAERTYSLDSALGLPDAEGGDNQVTIGLPDAEEDVGSSGDFGDDALS